MGAAVVAALVVLGLVGASAAFVAGDPKLNVGGAVAAVVPVEVVDELFPAVPKLKPGVTDGAVGFWAPVEEIRRLEDLEIIRKAVPHLPPKTGTVGPAVD